MNPDNYNQASLQSPFNQTNVVIPQPTPKKRGISCIKKIIILQLLAIVILVGIIIYLTQIRLVTIENITPVDVTVEDNTKSKQEIENLELAKIEKEPIPLDSLDKSYFIDGISALDSTVKQNIQVFSIQKGLSVKNILDDQSKSAITALTNKDNLCAYIDFTNDFEQTENYSTLAQNIINAVKNEGYKAIELSYSSVYETKDFLAFLKVLYPALTQEQISLSIDMLPLWGETQDYSYWSNSSRFYSSNIIQQLEEVAQYTNKIIILAYDYTTVYSILPGEISPIGWVEKIIQYFISKNIPRNKIVLSINTKGYLWGDRDISDKYQQNYILEEQQAQVLSSEAISSTQGLNFINQNGWTDKLASIVIDNQTKILVYSDTGAITNHKLLAADYGLGGIMFR